LVDLGNRAGIPVFGVRYATDFSWYKITSLNVNARKWVSVPTQLSEIEFVRLLHKMRGYDLPDDFRIGTNEQVEI
jgi:hypothetical protein